MSLTLFVGILLFALPLGADTFVIAAAIGAGRPTGLTRWRVSAIFVLFEAGMPLAGIGLGASIGQLVGSLAGYLSGALLVLLGGYLWWSGDDDDELTTAHRLTKARGLALVGLAFSISLDELAIGFSLGLGAGVTAPAAIVAVIAIQALLLSQLGLSVGDRVSEHWRDVVERCAGPMLIVLGGYLLAEEFIRAGLVPAHGAVAVGVALLILGTVIGFQRRARRTTNAAPETVGCRAEATATRSEAQYPMAARHGS